MLETTSRRPAPSTASQRVEREEDLDRLTDAIDRLDERERLAVHLYYLDSDPVRAAATADCIRTCGAARATTRGARSGAARNRAASHGCKTRKLPGRQRPSR